MKSCKYCTDSEQIHFDKDWNIKIFMKNLMVWNYADDQHSHIRIPINFCLHCGKRLRKPNEYEWGKCEVSK